MINRYSNLLVFVEGISRPYLLNDSNMDLYSIIEGNFYDRKAKIGRVIAFNVEHKIPVKLGEQPCPEVKCNCCPLSFCCEHKSDWSDTPFDILKVKMRQTDMSIKVYKFLHKKLNKNKANKEKI